ncbi:MAG: hypothetical protein QME60_03840 [Verrucomicrobiota bacterium]|nr:hypothetical protein [Verrucomicrobiota bacterium]
MATSFSDKDISQLGNLQRTDPALLSRIAGADRMARHKDDVTAQMSGTVSEIERLRIRQEELEREKKSLENLAQKQREYESGKCDIIEKLNRSLILLEKDETQARRMVEVMSQTRGKFQKALAELKGIDEGSWPESDFRDELSRALATVEAARDLYKRALAMIDASGGNKGAGRADAPQELSRAPSLPPGFGYWLKVGVAVTLPLAAVLALLFVGYLLLSAGVFFR